MPEPKRKHTFTQLRCPRRGAAFLRHSPPQSGESGFTILEALVALIIASIMLIGISPLVVISASARVQARRIDLATQAGRSYIDGLRSNSIPPPSTVKDLSQANLEAEEGPPTSLPSDPGACLDKNLNSIECTGGTEKPFLVIQAMRNGPDPVDKDGDLKNDPISEGYCVALRVYRGDAFDGGASPTKTEVFKNSLTNSKDYPVVVMRAEILTQASFNSYKNRFPGDSGSPCGPPA